MGRSVNYLTNAQYVTYFDASNFGQISPEDDDNQADTYDEYQATEDYEDFKSYITDILSTAYPSLEANDKEWGGREVKIIMDNALCQIGLSEYCGLLSVSIRVNQSYYISESLGIHWINQAWPNMLSIMNKAYPTMHLYKIGNFSNGEGVYKLVNQ